MHDWYNDLSTPRQHCILEMAYQMGVEGVMGFGNMIAALQREDYETASQRRWIASGLSKRRLGKGVAGRLRAG